MCLVVVFALVVCMCVRVCWFVLVVCVVGVGGVCVWVVLFVVVLCLVVCLFGVGLVCVVLCYCHGVVIIMCFFVLLFV